MSYNELLLILSSLFTVILVLAAWKLDKERLHSLILVFLILIALSGGKIVEFFGHVTNTGNIFYAGVFLATYFLIERYGKREGIRSIWIGIVGVLSFALLLFITLSLRSTEGTAELSSLLSGAFGPVPRLALASIVAYAAAQSLNIFLYSYLKERLDQGPFRRLWWRVNGCNILAQLLDSVVFFLIAFWGVVAPEAIWEILITGFVIKVVFVMAFSPLLYLNRMERFEDDIYVSLTIR